MAPTCILPMRSLNRRHFANVCEDHQASSTFRRVPTTPEVFLGAQDVGTETLLTEVIVGNGNFDQAGLIVKHCDCGGD